MPFRFRKRIKIFPGFHINLGKKGINSASIGPRGFTTNINSKGARQSVDLPGGFSYQTKRVSGSTPEGETKPYNFETVSNQITRTWRCSNCSALNPAENNFCGNCGGGGMQDVLQPAPTYAMSDVTTSRNSFLLLIGIVGGIVAFALICGGLRFGTPATNSQTTPRSLYTNSAASSPTPNPTATPGKSNTMKPAKTPTTGPETRIGSAYPDSPTSPSTRRSTQNAGGFIRGPRGGCYYINGSGNKTYVSRSMCN